MTRNAIIRVDECNPGAALAALPAYQRCGYEWACDFAAFTHWYAHLFGLPPTPDEIERVYAEGFRLFGIPGHIDPTLGGLYLRLTADALRRWHLNRQIRDYFAGHLAELPSEVPTDEQIAAAAEVERRQITVEQLAGVYGVPTEQLGITPANAAEEHATANPDPAADVARIWIALHTSPAADPVEADQRYQLDNDTGPQAEETSGNGYALTISPAEGSWGTITHAIYFADPQPDPDGEPASIPANLPTDMTPQQYLDAIAAAIPHPNTHAINQEFGWVDCDNGWDDAHPVTYTPDGQPITTPGSPWHWDNDA